MQAIEIKDLKFQYNKRDKAINGINLSIKQGEWISIIGHNGSGKSTLSKLIMGLCEANNGDIYIEGEKLTIDTVTRLRKKVGIVFQNPDNQFVGVTVKHDIAFGLENRSVERSKMIELVDEYARRVGMYEYIHKEPHFLSGGQKQRVAIAGVLATGCDIMIFDEATSMLDPEGVKDITNLLKTIHKDYGNTMITITHDLDLAALSDRIIVLNAGLIVLEGSPEEVFSQSMLLDEIGLDIPFKLKLYNAVKSDEELSNDKDMVDVLWRLNLGK